MSTIEQSEGLLSIFKRLKLFFIIVYCLNYFHFTLASILNVYKPSIYLDISLQWQNKSFLIILLDLLAAAGVMVAVQLIYGKDGWTAGPPIFSWLLLLDFFIQLGIIIDCYWGWRRMGKMMRSMMTLRKCFNRIVPANPDDIELSVVHQSSPIPQISVAAPSNIQVSGIVYNHGEGPYEGISIIKINNGRQVGYHRFIKPPVPYDNCTGVPISHLLTMESAPV